MLIQESALQHWLDHFQGFGSWNASTWFVGYEESGGDLPEELAEKLNWFFTTHPGDAAASLCDIRNFYRHVAFRVDGPRAEKFTTLYDYRFGAETKTLHGTWKNLIAFAQGYRNQALPDLLAYQKETFLSPPSGEALLHLYPLPAHNHAWYYPWLELSSSFAFLKSRVQYEQYVYPQRIHTLLTNIRLYKPKLVLMYGMENINALKKSVQEQFPATAFTPVKGVKLKTPQHHIADLQGTQLVLTTQVPSLRHNRPDTGFDWYALGKSLQR